MAEDWSTADTHGLGAGINVSPTLRPTVEQTLVPGEVKVSGGMVVGVGDTTEGAVDEVGKLAAAAAGIAKVEGALGIWSAGTEVRASKSRPPEDVTGTESGPEMVSEAAV